MYVFKELGLGRSQTSSTEDSIRLNSSRDFVVKFTVLGYTRIRYIYNTSYVKKKFYSIRELARIYTDFHLSTS